MGNWNAQIGDDKNRGFGCQRRFDEEVLTQKWDTNAFLSN